MCCIYAYNVVLKKIRRGPILFYFYRDQLELLIELQKADKIQRGKNTETSLSDILRGVVEDVQPMKKSSTENNAS